MIKREELSNPASCMNRAADDEMTFVLLGRDAAAPVAIRAWIMERLRLGKNKAGDAQITEARECARLMQPCRWCAEGYPRIRSSVSEAFVHVDTPTGRRVCKAKAAPLVAERKEATETAAALGQSSTSTEARIQPQGGLE